MAGKKNNRAVCSFQSADDPVGDHLPVAVLEMIAAIQQRASEPARDLTAVAGSGLCVWKSRPNADQQQLNQRSGRNHQPEWQQATAVN